MMVYVHEDDYFDRTPIEKQRVCCNCRNRVVNASMGDKCNIDGHRIGYIQCFSQWCLHWATDKARWESEAEE